MSIDIMKIIESKLNSLPKQSPKRNPLEHQRPPGFPPVGVYAPYKPMETYKAAVHIHALVKNSLFKKTWPIEIVWQRAYSFVINQIIHYADKCWRICSTSEAEDIVKIICEKANILFPPKFENTPNDSKGMSNRSTNNVQLKHLELTSASGSELNLEALYQIMPSAFTEVRDDKTGEITHKINFNTLRELLGDNVYEGADEEYGFKWVGKNAARREAARPINKTLRPCPEESVDWEKTQNLYIEGDNLEVLKLLQKSYLGKVKMIYIDPPYNTGNDFVYRDNFALGTEEYDLQAGNIDELGVRFRKNTESEAKGRFHSNWCSMIYERLLVARSLLSNDGVIFISIDDSEVQNLKYICEEIFGSTNFLAQVIWERAYSPINLMKHFSPSHDYILCYTKNIELAFCNGIPRSNEANARYSNPDNDERGVWKSSDLSVGPAIQTNIYPITTPSGRIVYPPSGYSWRLSESKFREFVSDNRIWFGNDGNNVPSIKRFLSELRKTGITPMTFWRYEEVGHSQDATQKLAHLFGGKKLFDYPKPVELIKRIVALYSANDSLILDFFSGSATTAHAVMKLNAEDGGNRKFIMVQLPEITEGSSEAYKAGYKNICEIGKERIRRAGKKIKEESGLEAQNLDTGFRVFKCEDSFMNKVKFSPTELKQGELFSHVSNIKEGTSDLSLLFGCMLDWGVQLSLPLSSFEVGGKTIYNVNDGDLVACFAEDVNEDVITTIADLTPLRVVFRDSCFSDVPLKMNLFELFKQKCGWSEEVVKNRVHVI